MTDEDINHMVIILQEMKKECLTFEYHDEKTANFVYHMDSIARTLLEIINGPTGSIERMI